MSTTFYDFYNYCRNASKSFPSIAFDLESCTETDFAKVLLESEKFPMQMICQLFAFGKIRYDELTSNTKLMVYYDSLVYVKDGECHVEKPNKKELGLEQQLVHGQELVLKAHLAFVHASSVILTKEKPCHLFIFPVMTLGGLEKDPYMDSAIFHSYVEKIYSLRRSNHISRLEFGFIWERLCTLIFQPTTEGREIKESKMVEL